MIGLALAAWFILRAGSFIYRWFADLLGTIVPVVAARAIMCVVDCFDFDLQIPAIAFFFAMILGLAVRISWSSSIHDDADEYEKPRGVVARISASIAVLGLLVATFVQPSIAYPYNLETPGWVAQAGAQTP